MLFTHTSQFSKTHFLWTSFIVLSNISAFTSKITFLFTRFVFIFYLCAHGVCVCVHVQVLKGQRHQSALPGAGVTGYESPDMSIGNQFGSSGRGLKLTALYWASLQPQFSFQKSICKPWTVGWERLKWNHLEWTFLEVRHDPSHHDGDRALLAWRRLCLQ